MKNKIDKTNKHKSWHHPTVRWGFQISLLFALWIALSGKLDVLFLTPGIISAVLVVVVTERIFHPNETAGFMNPPSSFKWLMKSILRMCWYVPYLIWEILIANFHVARLIISPSMPLNPALIVFESPLETESANALLAQSITLTPGTITVDMSRHRILVHCLSSNSLVSLSSGELIKKVANVYGQRNLKLPNIQQVTKLEEIIW